MRITNEMTVRGTAILIGEIVQTKRAVTEAWANICRLEGFDEIELPSLELTAQYKEKFDSLQTQMYEFPDRGDRQLCLRPEGTATCQLLARTIWKTVKDKKIFYVTRCWRYEKPQAGRYREFTQFGVEILNPTPLDYTIDYTNYLINMAVDMVKLVTDENLIINSSAKRGLGYYVKDGFEIEIPSLGAQKQVVGGGWYKEGVGFAIGLDRLLSLKDAD